MSCRLAAVAMLLLWALWSPVAFGQSPALNEAYDRFTALAAEGRYEEAEAAAREALALAESKLGATHRITGIVVSHLAYLLRAQGRTAEALPLYERSLAVLGPLIGEESADYATLLNNLALAHAELAQDGEAEALFLKSIAIAEAAPGPSHPDLAGKLNNLAGLYQSLGREAEAEPLYRRALAIAEAAGPEDLELAAALNNLAYLYQTQGRAALAEPLYRRALAIKEKLLGPDHPEVAATLNNLATVHQSLGRPEQAEPLYARALEIEEALLGPEHPLVASMLSNLAGLRQDAGRLGEAEPLYRRALAIKEAAFGPDHPEVAATLGNLAALYQDMERTDKAEPLILRALAIEETALGAAHPRVARRLNNLAALQRSEGRLDEALESIRRATAILAARAAQADARAAAGAESERRAQRHVFLGHLLLAEELAQAEPTRRAALTAEAFELAQLTRSTAAAKAVAGMAVRFAAGDDALAGLVRRRQDALARRDVLDEAIVAAAGQAPESRDAESESGLRAELAEIEARIAGLDARLAEDYPRYAEVADPRPLPLAEAQALLGPAEALVAFAVWEDESFLQVIRAERAGMAKLEIGAEALRAAVARLRGSLSPEGVDSFEELLARGFPEDDAVELYRRLLAPAEPYLEGATHVFLVPDDALQSLPLAVLLTDEPAAALTDFAGYRQAPWLARRYAMTTLPSVASLRALRRFARAARASKPFAGFGDPDLEGPPGSQRGVQAADLFRGALADVEALRRLPPLPDTADELRAIAESLGAGEESLFLRAEASERRVRQADLAAYRVIGFATHGLVAGEIEGAAEPALVLTPPATASPEDDGLLTASEIARDLALDADWVVLSACNTAAGETPGAEGLSGLAKAFFYAGSRALLVSHWPVSSQAAVGLTTGSFAALAADPGLGRAEALRRAMLALLGDTEQPYLAHPLFWAPFVVVGEGGGRRP